MRWINPLCLNPCCLFGPNRRRIPILVLFNLVLATGLAGFGSTQQVSDSQKEEEAQDYFEKWLDQDVIYLISDDEREVFKSLATPEEKEQFIEQFWLRRDPDPATAINEYKEEHYRRLAYANERFSVGMPGWMSDRGRIYIIHGPPDQIESHPTGGQYQRPVWEGGGWTQAYPWERWRYHYIEGIGADVELEFVDRSHSGQYKLALNPEEKDALLEMGTAGATMREIAGLEKKGDRPYFNPLNREAWMSFQRKKDSAFERYLTFAKVQGALPVKYKDLQELVKFNVTYQNLPFEVRLDYFRLNASQILVPVTLELKDKDLSFKQENGEYSAEVQVYGMVSSLANRTVQEFEDDLVSAYTLNDGSIPGTGAALYQKFVVVDNTTRYKLSLVVKDTQSGKVGVVQRAIVPPRYDPETVSVSSVVLSNYIYLLDELPQGDPMFVLGDVKIRPSLDNTFSAVRPLGVYFQAYHLGLDQTTLAPYAKVKFRIKRGKDTVVELQDETGEAIQYFTSERTVFIQQLPIAGLEAGPYRLEVEVTDQVGQKVAAAETDFELTEPGG